MKTQDESNGYRRIQQKTKLTLEVDAEVPGASLEPVAIGERLKEARIKLGMSQADLAKRIGGSKPGIQDNEAGKNMPGGKVIGGLVALGINANWLLTGKGPMLLSDLDKAGPTVDVRVMGMAIKELEEALGRSRRTLDPERKARAVGILYEFHKAGPQDLASVERLLDLVA